MIVLMAVAALQYELAFAEDPSTQGTLASDSTKPAGGAAANRSDVDAEYARKLETLAAKCDELDLPEQAAATRQWLIRRDPRRQYFFTPPASDPIRPDAKAEPRIQQWYSRFLALRKAQAASLWSLALETAKAGDGGRAYALLFELLREDPDHEQARRVLGYVRRNNVWRSGNKDNKPQQANIDHARVGWPKRSYWRYETDHFRIVTNLNEKAAQQLGERLEELHLVWRQLFFPYWSSTATLQARLNGTDEPLGANRRHEVVLFRNRAEYLAKLGASQPQIEVTLGLYHDKERTSFFYAGDDTIQPTWYHEATHQLFQETQDVPPDTGIKNNTWAVEAVALYMESLSRHPGYVTVGGIDADRLQFARYRTLRDDFYLPLEQLSGLSRDALQKHPDISKIYGEAAGLAHFFIDYEAGKYRSAFFKFLSDLYLGHADADTLQRRTGRSYAELDAEYRKFLQVSDEDLLAAQLSPLVRNLSLGTLPITDRGLEPLRPLERLEWVDLGFTRITDAGFAALHNATKIKQLFLEKTAITDASLQHIGSLRQLEELDLSGCPITDEGLASLSGLRKLKKLYLSGCPITDAGLKHLEGLKHIDSLELSATRVTMEGVKQLRRSLPLWKSDE
ncbi:MAG: hypothetical protein RIS70_978 [Planctomycetota bacterium]